MFKNAGQYNKTIVVVLGILAYNLQTYYGSAHWAAFAISIVTALSVFLVPNVSANTAEIVQPNDTSNVKVIS